MKYNETHVDEKTIHPTDKGTSTLTPEEIARHIDKPIKGYVICQDGDTGPVLSTEILREGHNLVLLSGREFIAQKIADVTCDSLVPASNLDLTKFKIRYFGIGSGGADTADVPNKIGPFDNDLDLRIPGKIYDIDTANYQYIQNGNLKAINSDGGNIAIVDETHSITINGANVTIDAMTTIVYTMYIRQDEMFKDISANGPFAFNEAALYAVHMDDVASATAGKDIPAQTIAATETSRFSADYRAFARFTTMTKWLEVKDSLKITWYILV